MTQTGTWTPESIEAACRKISGVTDGRGWQVAAAKRLGVSDKTLRAACDRENPSPSAKLERALVDALSGVTALQGDEELTTQAGSWVVGTPSDRTRDASVTDEVVVTHVSHPVFVLHLSVSGDLVKRTPTYRVKWLDEPSTPKRRDELLNAAKARAVDFLNGQRRKMKELAAHRAAQVEAGRRGNFDHGDIALMSQLQLASDRRKSEAGTATREGLTAALAQLERDAEAQFETFLGFKTDEERRAFRAGENMGQLRATIKTGMVARAYSDADLANFVFARHVSQLPLAHKETGRGGIRSAEDIEAERDEREMAAALAEDLRDIEKYDR